MHLLPKLAGNGRRADAGRRRVFGGALRFLAGTVIEIVFSFLLGAVTTFRITVFMIGLLFGRSVVWNGQARDAHGIAWSTATRGLWPPGLFGAIVCGALVALSPATFAWSLPLRLGYLLAVPFAALASPGVGRLLDVMGCALFRRTSIRRRDPVDSAGDNGASKRLCRRSGPFDPDLPSRCEAQPGHGRADARFLRAGDLAFDIGAHVGDRVSSSAASARVSLHSSPSPARPGSSASFMGATSP